MATELPTWRCTRYLVEDRNLQLKYALGTAPERAFLSMIIIIPGFERAKNRSCFSMIAFRSFNGKAFKVHNYVENSDEGSYGLTAGMISLREASENPVRP